MPDDPKIISSDNAQSKSDSVSNSPWDDDLPKEEAKQPMIVGGLEKKDQPAEQGNPVPFNIPKDVIEQKDKEKIPAIAVVKTPPIPPTKDTSGVAELITPEPVFAPSVENNTSAQGPQIIHQPSVDEIRKSAPASNATLAVPTPETPRVPPSPSNEGEKPVKGLLSIFSKIKKSPASPPPTTAKKKSASPIYKKFMLGFGIFIILFAGVFLTENGILSVGLENIYGAVGIESLWGGLSKSPEKALVISLKNASSNLDFKSSGTISISASKSSDSKIIGPLLSLTSLNIALNDQTVVPRTKAFLSAIDLYDTGDTNSYDVYDEPDSSYDDTSYGLESEADQINNYGDTSAALDSPDYVDTATDVSGSSNFQDPLESYTPETTVIKEINSEFKMVSAKSGFEADLTIKKIIGTEDNINLILSGSDLLLKANEKIKYSSKYKADKWLNFQLSGLPSGNALSETPAVDASSGFSIIGGRVSNEKIDGIRCYRYYLSKIEIGDALSGFGVDKDSVQSISGDIWIGIKDKLIHKADITIIPASSSGITKIHVVLNFSDYGVTNSLSLPTVSERVKVDSSDIDINGLDEAEDNSGDAYGEVPQSSGSNTSILDTEVARDTQRRSDLDKIKLALDSFKLANGRYPISSQIDKSTSGASILKSSLVPTYLSAIPSDPKSAEGWFYGYQSTDGVKFTLSARIESPNDTRSTLLNGIRLYWLKN